MVHRFGQSTKINGLMNKSVWITASWKSNDTFRVKCAKKVSKSIKLFDIQQENFMDIDFFFFFWHQWNASGKE